RPSLGPGPLGTCPAPAATAGVPEVAALLPALADEGPVGGVPEDDDAAELPPPSLVPAEDAVLPNPSLDPAANPAADCARAAAAPSTVNIVLPRSPSTIRFARNGMSRMQTENRILAAARSTSEVAPASMPPKLPAPVIVAMLLMLSAIANLQKIP